MLRIVSAAAALSVAVLGLGVNSAGAGPAVPAVSAVAQTADSAVAQTANVDTSVARASVVSGNKAIRVQVFPKCAKQYKFTVQKLYVITDPKGSDDPVTAKVWRNKGTYRTAGASQSKVVKLPKGTYRARVAAACGNPSIYTNSVTLEKFRLGADRSDVYGPILAGKRVGLMVNQSSLDSQGRHTIDQMIAAGKKYGFQVTTLFAVEHGLRGNEEAGFGDDDHIDAATGLQVYSLYGKDAQGNPRSQPTAAKLANVDVFVYDLQDVGVRFFTYTISMQYAMESIQAFGKEFMVLDRPNPNGDSVYGPLMEPENVSGIGTLPVPMAHGLTSGEFAKMIVGQGWLNGLEHAAADWQYFGQPQFQLPANRLHVIAMTGYNHADRYALPVRPSPNLPSFNSVRLYPSVALFEATSVNAGRGSDYPHQQLGFPDQRFYINVSYKIADDLTTAYGWPHGGLTVYGESLRQEVTGVDPMALRASIKPLVKWWHAMKRNGYQLAVPYSEESNYLKNAMSAYVIRPLWLAKLVGTRSFLTALQTADAQGLTVDQTVAAIEASWQGQLNSYLVQRAKYTLYPDV